MNILDELKKRLLLVDWILVGGVVCAFTYGSFLIKSATNHMDTLRNVESQAMAILIGLLIMFILSSFDLDHWGKYARYVYIVAVFMLVMVLVFGTGEEETGNNAWIIVPVINMSIQLSEIVKMMFIFTLSKHLDLLKEKINKPSSILALVIHAAIIIGLVMLEKDLGSSLVFMFVFISLLFAAGVSLWYFLGGIFVVAASSPIWWNMMSARQQARILIGFNPDLDPLDIGYQPYFSRFAIGSGGLFGAGYQKGYYTQRGTIPKQWTDFIYSAAGEEFGFIGAILVIIILTVILFRIFHISRVARTDFGSYICIGVFSTFMIQIIENIGMCLGMLPVIGITLPFFSAGGSSVLSSLIGVGLVLAINSRKKIYFFTHDELNGDFYDL